MTEQKFNEYMKDKEKFLPFIKAEERERFMSEYGRIFKEVGTEFENANVASLLLNWKHTGEIMMLLSNNTNWDDVDKAIDVQGHSGATMSVLTSKVLYFSPFGLDFVEHVYGLKTRKKVEKEMKKCQRN